MPTTSPPPLYGSLEGPSSWALVTAVATGTVIAVLLALAMATMDEGGETRPRAAVGQVISATLDDEDATDAAEVVLPWRRLDVGVGEPVRELPELRGAPADIASPEGGRFIPVQVEPVEDELLDGIAFTATERPLRTEARFVLTADGKEYPIDGAGGLTEDPNDLQTTEGRTRWVAVEGDPSTIEVTIITDGQEQTVRPDGTVTPRRAADLDDLPSREEVREQKPTDCGTSRRVDDSDFEIETSDPEECTITAALRTPFVDGLGWAPKGKEYLVVHVTPEKPALVESPDGEDGRWTVTQVDGRLGSTRPRAGPTNINALNEGTMALQATDEPEQLVFEVRQGRSTGDLVIGVDVGARPDDPFATSSDTERMRLEWTIPARRVT